MILAAVAQTRSEASTPASAEAKRLQLEGAFVRANKAGCLDVLCPGVPPWWSTRKASGTACVEQT